MKRLLLTASLSLILSACGGGGGPSGPTSLRYHYDQAHIAQLTIEQQNAAIEAQTEWQRARREQMRVESELREVKTDLAVAKNERKQAILAEGSAEQEKAAADSSGDLNRINSSTRDMRVAQLSRRAADDRVSYLKAHKEYLKKLLRYQEEETFHREARYEHEKAKLGQANNIQPRGVKYETFPEQVKERSRRAQKAKQVAEKAKAKSVTAEKAWRARLQEADRARGKGSATGAADSSNDDTGSSPPTDSAQ